ncbi:hypothetical protein EDB81DRAFT_893143 [Dactylonectria macrodidyma]|uniref:Uncharacterized protein n=1 Tax=Dactylonectria macrodidyma TaxID=307937 RepID=A0A9P9D6P4_9HYPO|nr:hypothetical protein EDB81DRAFT_893143 [Dactylonectria macrodidyma]
MSDKAPKKERVAKVVGRRLSGILLRTNDSKKNASPTARRPRTAQAELQSQRSSLTATNSQQRPASACSSPGEKRLSHRTSFRQRFWSVSSSNEDCLENQSGSRSSAYIPRHAASDFSKNASGPVIEDTHKVVGRRPSTARIMADEANARIIQRFSTGSGTGTNTVPTVREDDENTLCSLNEDPNNNTTAATASRNPSGELDGAISTLYREQALNALNEPSANDPRRTSDPSSPRALSADPDDSSDDEYGVFQDQGESRRHARRCVMLTAEVERSANRQSMGSFGVLSAPNRNSVYSNRSSLLSNQGGISSSSDTSASSSDRNSMYSTDPILHRNSTYMDVESLPTPDSLAALDKMRWSGIPNNTISDYTRPTGTDVTQTESQKRKPSIAQPPRVETVMEV